MTLLRKILTVACLFVLSIFGAQLVRIQGFDATAGLGFWTIKVEDQDAGNTGTLNGWSLRFIFQTA